MVGDINSLPTSPCRNSFIQKFMFLIFKHCIVNRNTSVTNSKIYDMAFFITNCYKLDFIIVQFSYTCSLVNLNDISFNPHLNNTISIQQYIISNAIFNNDDDIIHQPTNYQTNHYKILHNFLNYGSIITLLLPCFD